MIDIESLVKYERIIQNTRHPIYVPCRDDGGQPVYEEFNGIKYQWIHKLIDVKEGKGIYTTGMHEVS